MTATETAPASPEALPDPVLPRRPAGPLGDDDAGRARRSPTSAAPGPGPQWDERVRRLAGALRSLGVGRGDVVSFLDKNHPACVELTMAAASLGAANAIINFRLAGDEIDYAVNDSGAKVLLVGSELLPLIYKIRDRLVARRGGRRGDPRRRRGRRSTRRCWPRSEPVGRDPEVTPDDVCLVMYSSGTTGRPKGVMLTQANMIAHTAGRPRRLGLRPRRQEHGLDAAVPRRRLVVRAVRHPRRRPQRDDARPRRRLAGRRDHAGRQPHLPGAGRARPGAAVRATTRSSCSASSRPTATAPPRCRCRCCAPRSRPGPTPTSSRSTA